MIMVEITEDKFDGLYENVERRLATCLVDWCRLAA